MTTAKDIYKTRDERVQATLGFTNEGSNERVQRKASLLSTHEGEQTQTIDRLFSKYEGLFSHG